MKELGFWFGEHFHFNQNRGLFPAVLDRVVKQVEEHGAIDGPVRARLLEQFVRGGQSEFPLHPFPLNFVLERLHIREYEFSERLAQTRQLDLQAPGVGLEVLDLGLSHLKLLLTECQNLPSMGPDLAEVEFLARYFLC